MLHAGTASRDITPELRGDFFGYVRPDLRARGIALRLFAHALVLDDGARKVAVLTLDLGAPLVTDGILERVADAGFGTSNLLVAATHTHAGPNRPGPWVARQAAAALLAADAARVPARAHWADAEITDANDNRSLEAHLANHGLDLYPGTGTVHLDPHGQDHPRDTTLRLLRVEAVDGTPLAAWAQFSAHPTTFGPANRHFSADYPRAAIHHFRASFPGAAPTAIVTNGTEGDLIPRSDDVGFQPLADRIGRRVSAAMRRAWDADVTGPPVTAVAGAGRRITYHGQRLASGERVGDRAWFGLPFLGGAENGPSFLYGLGLQGRRRPRWLAGPVHGRKLVTLPAPHARQAEVTVLRLGERLLLGVPGEPSVEAGRRMRATALDAAGDGAADGLVVGLAQRYRGYFTTPQEYDQQHYEGGHTVFGRHTSRLVETTHGELAREVTGPTRGTPAPDRAGDVAPPGPPSAVVTGVPDLAAFGPASRRLRFRGRPPARVARLEALEVAWRGAPRGRDRPVGGPFVVLCRQVPGGWEDVADDLGLAVVWEQTGRRGRARIDLPVDLPTGPYRVELRGTAATARSRIVTVTACERLVLRGVTAADGRLVFRAQLPPPDPGTQLLARDPAPTGGRLRFRLAGEEREATWDADRGGWAAPVAAVPRRVHVPTGGLVDGHGNRSGAAVTLVVDRVAALDWPPPLGPGGGRSPGLFGWGTGRRDARLARQAGTSSSST